MVVFLFVITSLNQTNKFYYPIERDTSLAKGSKGPRANMSHWFLLFLFCWANGSTSSLEAIEQI